MQSRNTPASKPDGEKVPQRAALLALLAQYAAGGDAVLMLAAHQAVPLVAATAVGVFAAAWKFFDGLIE